MTYCLLLYIDYIFIRKLIIINISYAISLPNYQLVATYIIHYTTKVISININNIFIFFLVKFQLPSPLQFIF